MIAFLLCLFVSSSPAGTVNYRYDPLGQLTGVDYPDGGLIRYVCDATGNRVSCKVVPGGPGVDSDGDSLPNVLEIGTCADPLDADTDDDGILNGTEDLNHNGLVDAGERDPNVFNAPGMPWLPLLLASKPEGRLSIWFEPNPVPLYPGDNPCYSGVNE